MTDPETHEGRAEQYLRESRNCSTSLSAIYVQMSVASALLAVVERLDRIAVVLERADDGGPS